MDDDAPRPNGGTPEADETTATDDSPGPLRGPRGRTALAVAAVVLLLVGAVLLAAGVGRQEPAPPGRADAGPTAADVPGPPPSPEGAASGGSGSRGKDGDGGTASAA
ncbi:hypothetical protein ACFWEG_15755, partial [Streptomyces sp. NPDC060194]